MTVRADVPRDAEGNDTDVEFLGTDDTVAVFADAAGLALYCRVAEDHRLLKLEWWSQLADVEDDAVFEAGPDSSYDLRKPSERGADLVRELVGFCNLDLDLSVLDAESVDKDDWRDVVRDVASCLQQQD